MTATATIRPESTPALQTSKRPWNASYAFRRQVRRQPHDGPGSCRSRDTMAAAGHVGDRAGRGEVAKPGKVVPAPCNPPASTQVHPSAPSTRRSRGPIWPRCTIIAGHIQQRKYTTSPSPLSSRQLRGPSARSHVRKYRTFRSSAHLESTGSSTATTRPPFNTPPLRSFSGCGARPASIPSALCPPSWTGRIGS